ncbi:hypothetical protein OG851_42690 (plasmid) [Streptomyces sp. NBC_00161]|uniref:hypothetical protein n=1 Tax=Streptomyces sp. NBC_00161 TaxID=2975671 RepID=UPI002F911A01
MLTVATAATSSGPYTVIAILLAAVAGLAVFFGVQQPKPRGLAAGFWLAVLTAGPVGAGTYYFAESVMKNLNLL